MAGKTHCQAHSRAAARYFGRGRKAARHSPPRPRCRPRAGGGCGRGAQRGLREPGRQHRDAVLAALSVAHDDLATIEVDVLDAQPRALEQAQTGTVEQRGHEQRRASKWRENRRDFVPGEHQRAGGGALGADHVVETVHLASEHFAIEKQHGAEGLLLGGGADVPADGERRQERRDLGAAHLERGDACGERPGTAGSSATYASSVRRL